MDLDGDGDQDVISGSWPGELFFFERKPDGFAPRLMLKDSAGQIINIGGGVKRTSSGILITGNARYEDIDGASYAVYQDQKIPNTADNGVVITGTASAVHACDWDDDGDFDLLVGNIVGEVFLIPNVGTTTSWEFGAERQLAVDGKPLRVAGDAGPFAADWDHDGDLDLLVGDGKGNVVWFENEGSRRLARLATGVTLVRGPSPGGDLATSPQCGIRAKVCATDWNGDGKLDLLLGDRAAMAPTLPDAPPEQRRANTVTRQELGRIEERYSGLVKQLFGPDREKAPDKLEAIAKELEELSKQRTQLHECLPPDQEIHGWVWLFLRR